jgi:hypothetical protein
MEFKAIKVHRGDEFDPKLHQAVERIESDEIQPGFILTELLKGYMLKDRLLRPALVSVSKGETETASDVESDEGEIKINVSGGDDDGKTKFIDGDG